MRVNVLGSRLFIRPIMFDLELEWTVGGRAGYPHFPTPTSSVIFDRRLTPWYKLFPQPFAAMKIEDGGHNYCYENTEHSLA